MFGAKKRAFSMTYVVVLSTLLFAKSKLMVNHEWKVSHLLPYLLYLRCIIITYHIIIFSFYLNFICRLKRSKKT